MAPSRGFQHAVVALLLILLPFIVYTPLWSPADRITLGMDYPDFQPGQQLLFLQSLRDGLFPLWAPGDAGGVPFAVYFIAQQYSPVTWVLGALDATYDGLLLDLLTFWRLGLLGMSAFFCYLVARRLGCSTLPGIAAGFIYVFNLRMLDCFRYGSGLDAAVWLPVLVWLVDLIVERPRLRWLVLYALAQHMLVVSGHFQNAFYVMSFVAAWLLVRLWLNRSTATAGRRFRWWASRLGCMAGGVMLGLTLSAALLIPVVAQMMPLWTKRTLGGAAYYYEVHMTWRDLLCNIFFPWLADIHSAFHWSQAGWLLLAVSAVLLLVHRRRWPRQHLAVAVFLLIVFTLCMLYSLGPLTPVGPIFNAIVPGLTTFRAPGRIMIIGAFAAGLLIALAVDRLIDDPATRKTLWRVGPALVGLQLLAGAFLLVTWAAGHVRWGDTVDYVRSLWLPFIGSVSENAPARIHGWENMIPLMAALILTLALLNLAALALAWSNRLSVVGMVIALGIGALLETAVYHRWGTYIIPGRYYMPRAAKFKDVDVYHTRIFDHLSLFTYAKRNVLKPNHEPGELRFKFDLPGPTCEFLTDGGAPAWRIYYQNVRGHEIPRAYLTPSVRLVRGDDLAAIRELDPYAASVLDLADPINAPAEQDESLTTLTARGTGKMPVPHRVLFDQLNAEVQIDQYTPNKATFVVHASQPALFNYNDIFTPDWRATIDGRPARIYRVNHLYKGVVLPSGTHRVAFFYDPPSTWSSLALALGAACVWLALAGASAVARPVPRIAVSLLILVLAAPVAVHLHQLARTTAYRDGLINYNPAAPRPHAPDRNEYLWNTGTAQSP
ncbi:MAG TPA: hypothetical protein VLM89_16345 [Phycisphaerae bacterium]|nr:hypothetical protein [Phycisphaerae bacterium]